MPTPLRAALLAAWGTAYLQRAVSIDVAVVEIERADEPHLVVSDPLATPEELAEALDGLLARGVAGLRLALPAPGDLLGLSGPPAVNQAALAAGEAAIGVPGAGVSLDSLPAFVPDVTAFGSPGDQGHCVTWREMPSSAATPDVPTLAQADRDLREAVRDATDLLTRLGVSSWAAEGRETAGRLRSGRPRPLLPEVAGARAEAVAQRALQVLAITEAARADDSGAVTAFAVQSRRAALAPLDRVGRRALLAAAGAVLAMTGSRPVG